MTDSLILARRIACRIERFRIDVSTEAAANRSIRDALESDGIICEAEVRLTPKDRIDLLAGTVGIEVKVAGSRRDVARQLERYAASDRIEALVLATGIGWPKNGPVAFHGKSLFVASLSRGWL